MRRVVRGFTLVEMLVTLAVAAALLLVGAPGFGALRDEWALRAATHAVLGGLAQARLGALSRQGEGSLCPSRDGVRCAGRGSAYLVRATSETAEHVLHVGELTPAVELSANRPAATYYPWPRSAAPVTLTLCAVREHTRSRLVIVSQTGRPRVVRSGPC
jgi:type IV fimbrial biogenesis protein FimT